jgi:ParB family chromosome partitioning protein
MTTTRARKQNAAGNAALITLPLDDIRVGTRPRRDMGDIDALAQSIKDIGLLHPIIVDEDGLLLAGARRLAACKRLGWREIPVKVLRVQP